jgi:putative phage-type endonuclease
MKQGTPEWFAERLGKVTASRVSDVLAKIKSGEAAARSNYRAELVAQRLTGYMEEGFTNAAMQHGNEYEKFARAQYEIKKDVMVDEIGFVSHPVIEWAGASPDGLIGDDGLIEIKCPNTATHIDYLLAGKAPSKYIPQMVWQLACTGRKWCDFVSFDPRMPEEMQLFIVRFDRNDEQIAETETEVRKFLTEVESTISKLRAIVRPEPTINDYINTP